MEEMNKKVNNELFEEWSKVLKSKNFDISVETIKQEYDETVKRLKEQQPDNPNINEFALSIVKVKYKKMMFKDYFKEMERTLSELKEPEPNWKKYE